MLWSIDEAIHLSEGIGCRIAMLSPLNDPKTMRFYRNLGLRYIPASDGGGDVFYIDVHDKIKADTRPLPGGTADTCPAPPHASCRSAAPVSGPLRGGGMGAADTSAEMWKPRGGGGGGSRVAFANRPHQKARQCIGGPPAYTLRYTWLVKLCRSPHLPVADLEPSQALCGHDLRAAMPLLAGSHAQLRYDQRAGTTCAPPCPS